MGGAGRQFALRVFNILRMTLGAMGVNRYGAVMITCPTKLTLGKVRLSSLL